MSAPSPCIRAPLRAAPSCAIAKAGARDFVFNLRDSANRHIRIDAAATAVLAKAGHLHVVGSSLGAEPVAAAALEAIEVIKRQGGTVSFDPNIRKEMLAAPGFRDAMQRIIAATDLFLPSGDELQLFSDQPDPIRDLLDRGISAVVHKHGAEGARYVDRETDITQSAFAVEELDPTGAGDIFGGTFVAGWLRGLAPAENLRLASCRRRACGDPQGADGGRVVSCRACSFPWWGGGPLRARHAFSSCCPWWRCPGSAASGR